MFALALQLTLSFGHIHPEDIFGPAGAAAPVAANASIGLSAAGHPGSWSTGRHSGPHDDYCAICATTYLLGSSFVPEPPQLAALAVASQPITHDDAVADVLVAPRRAPFQPRAPPLA